MKYIGYGLIAIGKGIATIGIWLGAILIAALSIITLVGPIAVAGFAATATVAIWTGKEID